MGCYIYPGNALIIEDVAMAIRTRPHGEELLVAGNLLVAGKLNYNLADPEGTPKGEAISDELVAAGLDDTGLHFLPWHDSWFQDRCTWTMRQEGQKFRSHMDYILRTDCRLFQDVAARDPQNNLNYYMVLGCLRGIHRRSSRAAYSNCAAPPSGTSVATFRWHQKISFQSSRPRLPIPPCVIG